MSRSDSKKRGDATPQRSRGTARGGSPSGQRRRWLWPWLVTGVALAATVAILVFARPGSPVPAGAGGTGTAVLRVDRDEIDLGRVPLDQWVEAQFTLANAGDGPLRFTRIPIVEAVRGC